MNLRLIVTISGLLALIATTAMSSSFPMVNAQVGGGGGGGGSGMPIMIPLPDGGAMQIMIPALKSH